MNLSQVLAGVLAFTTIGTWTIPLTLAQTIERSSPLDLTNLNSLTFETITQRIERFGNYITSNNTDKPWTFDTAAAKRDGVPRVFILLGQEMVSFKNDLYESAMKAETQNVALVEPKLEQYPLLKRFLERATQRANELKNQEPDPQEEEEEPVTETLSLHQNKVLGIKVPKPIAPATSRLIIAASTITDCGWWNNPKPKTNPQRKSITSSDARRTLTNYNYHNTAGYACGNGIFSDPCANDYTRGRSYGNCSSPIFRNHATVTSHTTYSVQYGEPNPEVYSIAPYGYDPGWPSVDWDIYVWWWHETRN